METLNKGQHSAYKIHYHFVTPIKYRKSIFGNVERCKSLIQITKEIEERYEIHFEQVGLDENHVHYLLSSSPKFSPSQLIRTIKSIIARELFKQHPDLKKELWGGELWSDGYFVATVGEGGNRDVIFNYVAKQGIKNPQHQLKFFNLDR